MQRAFPSCLFLLVFVLATPHLYAQSDNVGYYVFERYDGNNTIYRLVHSTHVPGVENAPSLPGDIVVNLDFDDSGCHGAGGPPSDSDCIGLMNLQPDSKSMQKEGRTTSGPSNDGVPDRITVIGRRRLDRAIAMFLRSIISPLVPMVGIAREIDKDQVPRANEDEDGVEECTASGIGDMGELLTPEQQELISNFLNSDAAQSLWDDSGYYPGIPPLWVV